MGLSLLWIIIVWSQFGQLYVIFNFLPIFAVSVKDEYKSWSNKKKNIRSWSKKKTQNVRSWSN